MNPFGHIDLRVRDLAAHDFYETLLPALGFTVRYHGERAIFFADPSGNRLEVYYRPEI